MTSNAEPLPGLSLQKPADAQTAEMNISAPSNQPGFNQSLLSDTAGKSSVLSKVVDKFKNSSTTVVPEHDGVIPDDDDPLELVHQDPAFNPSLAVQKKPSNSKKTIVRALKTARTIGTSVRHPKGAVKHKAAKTTAAQLSKADRHFLSGDADLEYLKAHDELKWAETRHSVDGVEMAAESRNDVLGERRSKVERMEKHRESLRAAWTTSRHVRRVKALQKRSVPYADLESFTKRDAEGNIEHRDGLRWLGNFVIYFTQDYTARYVDDSGDQPFGLDTTRHLVERLVMVSAPWQSFLMKARSVARWDEPKVTFRWLLLYLFLWYKQYIVAYLYGYIVYVVLRNRFYPNSVESLRSSMQRALDSRDNAHKFSELIDRHGSGNWLEPFLEEFGPVMQTQLNDLVEMLEVLFNFYHWMSPRKTAATVFFFGSCLLISLFADMKYCVKIVWFIVGFNFFISAPISSRYPNYRHLVSSIKWVYWDIPTHAEWSFVYLQRQALETRRRMLGQQAHTVSHVEIMEQQNSAVSRGEIQASSDFTQSGAESEDSAPSFSFHSTDSSISTLAPTDIRSFRAYLHGGVMGHFIVFTTGIRFTRSHLINTSDDTDDEVWRFPFDSVIEMQKFDGGDEAGGSVTDKVTGRLVKSVSSLRKSSNSASGAGRKGNGGLEIFCIGDTTLTMRGLKERDEAFNAVIAFSGLQWKNLQGARLRSDA